MAFKSCSLDPDDIFNKVLFMENSLLTDGYNEGFISGKSQGKKEGYELGVKQGREIGKEIGFYVGFIAACKILVTHEQDEATKVSKVIEQLDKILSKFSFDNAADTQLDDRISEIRNKFKVLMSRIKMPIKSMSSKTSQMSF